MKTCKLGLYEKNKTHYLIEIHGAHCPGGLLQLWRRAHSDASDALQEGVNVEECRERLKTEKKTKHSYPEFDLMFT